MEPDSATAMLRECCAVFRSTAEREVSDGIGQMVNGSFRVTNIDEQSPVDFLVHRHARRIQRAMRRRAVLTVPYFFAGSEIGRSDAGAVWQHYHGSEILLDASGGTGRHPADRVAHRMVQRVGI